MESKGLPMTSHVVNPTPTKSEFNKEETQDPSYKMGTVPSEESKGERNDRQLHRS
jgi:hypothetical protein